MKIHEETKEPLTTVKLDPKTEVEPEEVENPSGAEGPDVPDGNRKMTDHVIQYGY